MTMLIVVASVNIPAVFAAELETPVTETIVTETLPAETVPVQNPSAETTPAETIPAETALAETVPVETVLQNTIPLETLPQETAPVQTVPEETIPVQPAPEEPAAEAVTEPAEPEEERDVTMIPSLEELPEVSEGYDSVPLYFQTDYPNTMFGRGTIANNGCGITCLAMVATYLTGHEYLPDELARYFGGVAESNMDRLEKGAEAMQLPWEKMENFHKTMEALREGKVVIALMDSLSLFTDTQHFIVLTGFNEDGLIMVNDPAEPNYEKWDLKRAFREGFTENDICYGFSGAWAFDKSAMPEEPFLYYEEDLRGEPRYPDIMLNNEDRQLLAKVIWVEAQGECKEGQQAVAEVVLNRMASPNFGDTLKSVIYAQGQFRSVPFLEDADPHQAQYDAIERAIYGPYVLPEDVVHFATYPTNNNVWGQIGGHIFCYEY
mgnify:CR=1 FL=1